jgi:hypothetical protein
VCGGDCARGGEGGGVARLLVDGGALRCVLPSACGADRLGFGGLVFISRGEGMR